MFACVHCDQDATLACEECGIAYCTRECRIKHWDNDLHKEIFEFIKGGDLEPQSKRKKQVDDKARLTAVLRNLEKLFRRPGGREVLVRLLLHLPFPLLDAICKNASPEFAKFCRERKLSQRKQWVWELTEYENEWRMDQQSYPQKFLSTDPSPFHQHGNIEMVRDVVKGYVIDNNGHAWKDIQIRQGFVIIANAQIEPDNSADFVLFVGETGVGKITTTSSNIRQRSRYERVIELDDVREILGTGSGSVYFLQGNGDLYGSGLNSEGLIRNDTQLYILKPWLITQHVHGVHIGIDAITITTNTGKVWIKGSVRKQLLLPQQPLDEVETVTNFTQVRLVENIQKAVYFDEGDFEERLAIFLSYTGELWLYGDNTYNLFPENQLDDPTKVDIRRFGTIKDFVLNNDSAERGPTTLCLVTTKQNEVWISGKVDISMFSLNKYSEEEERIAVLRENTRIDMSNNIKEVIIGHQGRYLLLLGEGGELYYQGGDAQDDVPVKPMKRVRGVENIHHMHYIPNKVILQGSLLKPLAMEH